MKYNYLTNTISLLLCFACCLAQAQITFKGIVKDSIGSPLELANVIAINKKTQALDAYSVTNVKGEFKLALKKNSRYELKISYIGMVTLVDTVDTKSKSISKNYTLQNNTVLDEVELVYEMPVTVKGDTIVYNADAFKNGTERKLEDILKKLPGVEVNDDGEIEVEGKKVTKVMVEDKDFFDGDSKLATKNIPASAVDKVQVLKNHSEISQLSGVSDNRDNIAINIKLKEGKKNFWFGTVTAGAGVAQKESIHLLQPKLFYYSPKYSINAIGDLNNIGEVAFTRRDYFNFTGGFKNLSSGSGTTLNLGDNGLGFLTLQNNRAKAIDTKFGALNFSYSPTKTWDISGFSILTKNKTTLQQNANKISTTPERPDEFTTSETRQESNLGMIKLSAKHKPNDKKQLDYDILGRLSQETQNLNDFSSVLQTVNQTETSQPFSINQNLNYYYTLNDKHIFSLEAQHLIKDEDPFYSAFLEDKTNYNNTATSLGLNTMQDHYLVNQEKQVKSNQLEAKLDYWYLLGPKSHVNVTLGTLLSKQDFNTDIFQTLDNGETFNPTPSINNGLDFNDTSYGFSDWYLGLHYRLKTGIFTFTPGLSLHNYQTKVEQFNTETSQHFSRVLPDFNMRMQLKESESVQLRYRVTNQFTDVTKLASGLVLNNYNALYSGNPKLENALYHALNLSYSNFNLFNYTIIFGNISYTKNKNNIRNTSRFEPGSVVNVSSSFNSNFADESLNAFGRFERSFLKIKASINANFNYSKYNQFINNRVYTNENYSQTYRLGLRSNFKTAPNIDLGYRFNIQDNEQSGNSNTFYTHAPNIKIDAFLFKSLSLITDYTFNDFRNKSESLNTYQFWNARINYKKAKDSKWEYELKATNLLNSSSQNNSSTSNFYISSTEYFIQPRLVTFRLIYNL